MNIIIQAYNDRLEYETKQKAVNTYILADLIGASVGRLLDKNAKYPRLWEVFPDLFEEEIKPRQQDWRLVKEYLLDFADGRNKEMR